MKLSKAQNRENLESRREKRFITNKEPSIYYQLIYQQRPWKPGGSRRIYRNCKQKTNSQHRILYLAKVSFKTEREIKTFPENQKPRESIDTRLALQEVLKGVLQVDMNEH